MKKGKIITCISAVAGNGAKYTATMMAYALTKKYPKKKIALVDFDLSNPYLFAKQTVNDRVHGIDNLVDKISSDVLQESSFRANMITIPGLFDLLKGTQKIGRENMIARIHVTTIIELLKNNYDYIVIVVPPKNNNAATIYSLYESDEIIMVVRPNFANLLNVEDSINICTTHRKSASVPVNVIYNMRGPKDDIDSFTNYMVTNDITPLGYMAYEADTVDNQNIGGTTINEIMNRFSKKSNSGGNLQRIKTALDLILGKDDEED